MQQRLHWEINGCLAVKHGQRKWRLLNVNGLMPLTFRASARLAVAVFSLFCSGLSLAQNSFSPGGPDYAIAGHFVGDQTMPHIALGSAGGWLVWQDNAVDGDGLGIRGLRLDSKLQSIGSSFQVNVSGLGDQAKPQVALLSDGGAVVVWQGGRVGFQNVYARFFGPSGQVLTSDLLVNSITNTHQVTPVVAVNPEGTVLVVWAGMDVKLANDSGPDRLLGIYGQRFSTSGTKLGGQFRINSYTLDNQRSPTVAALVDGRFIVGWVSERQRGPNSVDVYARVVTSSGAFGGSHFAINVSITNACANPSVAAAPDGGFLMAWSQQSAATKITLQPSVSYPSSNPENPSTPAQTLNLDQLVPNGWDVFFRHYSPAVIPTIPARQLNTFSYGDQYAPKISAFGRDYLATWVSLGQDGSREGIYGQFFSAGSATVEGVEFRVNSETASRQLHPVLATDGDNRFIVSWSAFFAGTSFDVMARAYDIIRVQTTPSNGSLLLTWNAVPGFVYRIQRSVNFGPWLNVGDELTAENTSLSSIVSLGEGSAIFRVVRVR